LQPDSAENHYRLSRVYQSLGLRQAAAEQTAMIAKLSAQQDQREVMARKFAREMLDSSKNSTAPR
jgi:hypothetical protein